MIAQLCLNSLQTAINHALYHNPVINDMVKNKLGGQLLRVITHAPNISIDMHFDADTGDIFLEPTVYLTHSQNLTSGPFNQPDFCLPAHSTAMLASLSLVQANCTLRCQNIVSLATLINHPGGNIPVTGDMKVLQHLIQIIDDADLDLAPLIQPFFGASMAQHLRVVIDNIRREINKKTRQSWFYAQEWLREDSQLLAKRWEFDAFKKDLQQLHIDIERYHAIADQLIETDLCMDNES